MRVKYGTIKFLTLFLLAICLFLLLNTNEAYANGEIEEAHYGDNIAEYLTYYSEPLTSFLTETDDGQIMRFQSYKDFDGYLVEYYSKNYVLQKQMMIPEELPIFGEFLETDDYYFIISGDLGTVHSYRVTKYDKDWNRICSADLADSIGNIPFKAGGCRTVEYNGYLITRAARVMASEHQANVTFQYSIAENKFTDSFTSIGNINKGYVSHSFNQFVCEDDGKLVACDHWEGTSRAVVICKYSAPLANGRFHTGKSDEISPIIALSIPGSGKFNSNYTGTFLGGFEKSSSSYLVSGNSSVDNSVDDTLPHTSRCRNIFVSVVDRATNEVTVKWLTDYGEKEKHPTNARLVKINDNEFYVIWSKENNAYYQRIDGKGNTLSDIYTFEGAKTTGCDPVLIDGKIIWFRWLNYKLSFYEIPIDNPSEPKITQIGENVESVNITNNFERSTIMYVGDTYQFETEVLPENASNKKLEWSVTNPESLSVDGNGLVTITGAGTGYVKVKTTDGSDLYDNSMNINSYYKLNTLEYNSPKIDLELGETADFYLTKLPEEGTRGASISRSYNPSSDVVTIDSENKTVTGVKPGIITYYAYSVDGSGLTAACRITVYGTSEAPTSLSAVNVTADQVILSRGDNQEYSIDGETWQTSNVFNNLDPDTEYEFYTRKKAQLYYHESEAYGPIKVRTNKQLITSLTVSPTSISMVEGDCEKITETILPENASDKSINWTSSDPSAVKVERNPDGEVIVTALKYCRSVKLTGTANDNSGKKVSVSVKVSEREHAWDEGTYITRPTCSTVGEIRYFCSVCGQYSYVEVPKLEHDIVIDEAVDATCIANGLTEGSHCSLCGEVFEKQEVIPAYGHEFTEWEDVRNDQTLFTRKCTRCDLVETETHKYDDGLIEKEATCTEDGIIVYSCMDPECDKTKTEIIPATGHTEVKDYEVPATCTESGLTEGSHCATCGFVFTEQRVIPAHGHDWENGKDPEYHEKVPATLTSLGIKSYYKCSSCERLFEDTSGQTELLLDDLTYSLFEKDGLNEYEGDWYYIKNGVLDDTFTGTASGTIEGVKSWYYVKDGKVDFTYKGFARVGESWMYFTKGRVDKSLNADEYETYCGVIDDLNNGEKGWFVVKKGKAYLDYTGFCRVGDSYYYYVDGVIDKSIYGAINASIKGERRWYYVKGGKVMITYTGFGLTGSSYMYFNKGIIDKTVNGVKSGTIDGVKGKFYVKSGKFDTSFSGKYKSPGGKTYIIKNGKVVE